MDKKMKVKWLKALRSGEYVQTKHRLVSRTDSFCCLGVLCNLSDMGYWEKDACNDWWYIIASDNAELTLPFSMKEALGITGNELGVLTSMNDNGNRFPKIADWIEKNL